MFLSFFCMLINLIRETLIISLDVVVAFLFFLLLIPHNLIDKNDMVHTHNTMETDLFALSPKALE